MAFKKLKKIIQSTKKIASLVFSILSIDKQASLERYEASVKSLFRLRSSDLFPNGDAERARILIAEIIRVSVGGMIRISTHKLEPTYKGGNNEVKIWGWSPVLGALESFLKECSDNDKIALRILLRDADAKIDNNHPMHAVLSAYRDKVEVRRLKSSENVKILPSMITSGGTRFREETRREINHHFARASANAPSYTKKLEDAFDEVFFDSEKTEPVDL